MTDARPPTGAAEAAVGDEGHAVVEPCAGQCRCGREHLGMPGPPLGPTLRMTTTQPGLMVSVSMAAMSAGLVINTRAGPRWASISGRTAASLTTAPLGARLPKSMASPPVA